MSKFDLWDLLFLIAISLPQKKWKSYHSNFVNILNQKGNTILNRRNNKIGIPL